MNGEEAIKVLQTRTGLEVRPHAILAAIDSQPGDVEIAVKQVVDWFATGEARSKQAGVLLLAALRSQARPRVGGSKAKSTWEEKVAEAKRLVPHEHPPFAAMAVEVLRFGGHEVTPESVRGKLRSEGRDMKSLLARAAAEERENEGAA